VRQLDSPGRDLSWTRTCACCLACPLLRVGIRGTSCFALEPACEAVGRCQLGRVGAQDGSGGDFLPGEGRGSVGRAYVPGTVTRERGPSCKDSAWPLLMLDSFVDNGSVCWSGTIGRDQRQPTPWPRSGFGGLDAPGPTVGRWCMCSPRDDGVCGPDGPRRGFVSERPAPLT